MQFSFWGEWSLESALNNHDPPTQVSALILPDRPLVLHRLHLIGIVLILLLHLIINMQSYRSYGHPAQWCNEMDKQKALLSASSLCTSVKFFLQSLLVSLLARGGWRQKENNRQTNQWELLVPSQGHGHSSPLVIDQWGQVRDTAARYRTQISAVVNGSLPLAPPMCLRQL